MPAHIDSLLFISELQAGYTRTKL
ncbi:hypothetical protein NC652_020010 [Populus alba x Populus x berolinensis]|nr:hypothetical protein NC652_020010 [Populus alba x Populus x berolinensis]